jgi:preprotein translocase SecE subunit
LGLGHSCRDQVVIDNFKGYFQDVAAEMRKVTWPKPEVLRGNTILVFVMTFLLTVFIGGVDLMLSTGMKTLHSLLRF